MSTTLDEHRRRTFLRALRLTGNFRAAARAASPASTHPRGAEMTFRCAMQRDSEFAAEVADARRPRALPLTLLAEVARKTHGKPWSIIVTRNSVWSAT